MQNLDRERLEYLLMVLASENRWLGHYQTLGDKKFMDCAKAVSEAQKQGIIEFVEGLVDCKESRKEYNCP